MNINENPMNRWKKKDTESDIFYYAFINGLWLKMKRFIHLNHDNDQWFSTLRFRYESRKVIQLNLSCAVQFLRRFLLEKNALRLLFAAADHFSIKSLSLKDVIWAPAEAMTLRAIISRTTLLNLLAFILAWKAAIAAVSTAVSESWFKNGIGAFDDLLPCPPRQEWP